MKIAITGMGVTCASGLPCGTPFRFEWACEQGVRRLRVICIGDRASLPNDCAGRGQTGCAMGEGAAALMLESEASAQSRHAEVLGWVRGFGHTSDITHISRPGVASQVAAIRAALSNAEVPNIERVGYINAHGTATALGDAVEAESIREAFGVLSEQLPVSSTKALHGHLLGGAGALESVVTVTALRRGMLPANAHLRTVGADCQPLTKNGAGSGRTSGRTRRYCNNAT